MSSKDWVFLNFVTLAKFNADIDALADVWISEIDDCRGERQIINYFLVFSVSCIGKPEAIGTTSSWGISKYILPDVGEGTLKSRWPQFQARAPLLSFLTILKVWQQQTHPHPSRLYQYAHILRNLFHVGRKVSHREASHRKKEPLQSSLLVTAASLRFSSHTL